MAEQKKQTAICELRRAGNSYPEIIWNTDYPKSTVYQIVAKFDAEGTADRRPHNPRNNRKRTKAFLAGMKRSLKADSTPSMAKLAKKTQCE